MIDVSKLSINDFYVAVQAMMTNAHEAGWNIDDIEQHTIEAAEEWLEEMVKDLPDVPEFDA